MTRPRTSSRPAAPPVTGLVLAAGGSRRLGQPKQLLPYAGTTLLGATMETARQCGFDQLIVTVGGAADEVVETVDLHGALVVRNTDFSSGCSSSIVAALEHVDAASEGIVLLLGDQPLVQPSSVAALVAAAAGRAIGACAYTDGLGHPFWLGRTLFGKLAQLHGDKGVWKLVDAAADTLVTVPVDTPVPVDVDTMEDYRRLLAGTGSGR